MHTSLAATVPDALPSRFRSSPCLNCFTTVTVVFASGLKAVFRLSSHASALDVPGVEGGGTTGRKGSEAPEEPPPQAASVARVPMPRQAAASRAAMAVRDAVRVRR